MSTTKNFSAIVTGVQLNKVDKPKQDKKLKKIQPGQPEVKVVLGNFEGSEIRGTYEDPFAIIPHNGQSLKVMESNWLMTDHRGNKWVETNEEVEKNYHEVVEAPEEIVDDPKKDDGLPPVVPIVPDATNTPDPLKNGQQAKDEK